MFGLFANCWRPHEAARPLSALAETTTRPVPSEHWVYTDSLFEKFLKLVAKAQIAYSGDVNRAFRRSE